MFGGLTELEFLARIAGESQTNPYEIVRATFGWFGGRLEEIFVQRFSGQIQPRNRRICRLTSSWRFANCRQRFVAASGQDNLEVIFYRDAKVDDGRYANNGWMQELPDPITKMTWDNAVLVSRKTARELGVANGDVVEISLNGRTVSTARSGCSRAWRIIRSASRSVTVAKRQGASARASASMPTRFSAENISRPARRCARPARLTCWPATQHHWSMEGRPAVREANLEEFLEEAEFRAEKCHGAEPPIVAVALSESARRGEEDGAASVGHGGGFERVRRLRHLRASRARARTTFRLSARTRCSAAAKCTGCALTAITRATRSGKIIRASSISTPTRTRPTRTSSSRSGLTTCRR